MPPEGHCGRTLRVHVADGRGRPFPARGLAGWLARVAPARARGEVSVALVSDAHVRALNKRYRRRDYATDVLSFPSAWPSAGPKDPPYKSWPAVPGPESRAPSPESRSPSPESRSPSPYFGDIAIARGVARRQARAAGHSELTEWRLLALHGLLHLLGYDHEGDEGDMARVERALRRKGGLRESLLERQLKAERP